MQKRIRVGALASLARALEVFRVYSRKFRFFSDSGIFSVFEFFGHFSQLWLFIMNECLFIMKKDRF